MEHEKDILISKNERETTTYEEGYREREINPTVKRETERFTDYSNEKKQKTYEEYEVVQTYMPKRKNKPVREFDSFISEQNSYIPATETFIYEKTKQKPDRRLKNTNKIFIIVGCAIALLLGSITVVNAVEISKLNLGNSHTTEQIANVAAEIKQIDTIIEEIIDESNVTEAAEEAGYTTVISRTPVDLNEKNIVEEYRSQTSLFDRICNFFSRLFGG